MGKWQDKLVKIDDYRWLIPCSYKPGMLVPGLIYATESMLENIIDEQTYEQVANVATLPGILRYSYGMPDIHWGYGFPIGGVAAMKTDSGVISPGGVGYDINCGVRLLRTNILETELKTRLNSLINELFINVPSGLGTKGRITVSDNEMRKVLSNGGRWAVDNGFGTDEDLELTEDNGCIAGANPDKVSERAIKRGKIQIGTLGSGNHFIEIQAVNEIYDKDTANVMGITDTGQVVVLIHTGSRGFGHQVCTDYLKIMENSYVKHGINPPDRQLACAPIQSSEGKDYYSAMSCAANYAWCNRQCISHWIRESFTKVLHKTSNEIGIRQVYDVAHNIAKFENHIVDNTITSVCVHRKGATRAYAPEHKDIPASYKGIGQPVLIPGDMGRCSYIAVGTQKAMSESFGSTCHGAGRLLGRNAARRVISVDNILRELHRKEIIVKTGNRSVLQEEASEAYKDVTDIVQIVHEAGISRKIVKTIPLAVVKG